jgi:serine phosphatase RsbU (regulator of sigma subunit)
LRLLLRSTHLASADDLPVMVSGAGAQLGAVGAVLYVVDYDQVLLVPLAAAGDAPGGVAGEPVAIEGTLAGRAFTALGQHTSAAGSGPTLWTPVLDGTERLGVLQFDFPGDVPLDEELRATCLDVARLVAMLMVTKSMYGDAVERARRRAPMTIPAELQWRLLPPLTFISPRVAVAGALAPTAEVAGDSFDYALNGATMHVAVIDAMGHGLEATLLSGVAIAALRNARRGSLDLAETVAVIDATIGSQFGPDEFVTGIVGELDVCTGWWRWATCGHPPTLLVRGGHVVKVLDSIITPPLGLGLLDGDPSIAQERLEPGDRLLLYTDGVIEARDSDGEFFGTERLVEFITRQSAAGLPAAETLRRLNRAILAHQDGTLQDDATTVMVEWLTDQPQRSIP